MQLNISGILGPALAGVLLLKVGAPVIFALNALGFLLVSSAIPRLNKTSLDLGQAFWMSGHSIVRALSYVGRSRGLRNVLFVNVVFSSFVVAIPALAPVLLLKELHPDGSWA